MKEFDKRYYLILNLKIISFSLPSIHIMMPFLYDPYNVCNFPNNRHLENKHHELTELLHFYKIYTNSSIVLFILPCNVSDCNHLILVNNESRNFKLYLNWYEEQTCLRVSFLSCYPSYCHYRYIHFIITMMKNVILTAWIFFDTECMLL